MNQNDQIVSLDDADLDLVAGGRGLFGIDIETPFGGASLEAGLGGISAKLGAFGKWIAVSFGFSIGTKG